MLIKKPDEIRSGEVPPKELYLSRRTFVRGAVLVATAAGTAWLYRRIATPPAVTATPITAPTPVASTTHLRP
ncbi:MAG: hypothetical protein ABSH53_05865 [Holophaga sp.]